MKHFLFYLTLGGLVGALIGGGCKKSATVDPVVTDTTHITPPPDTTHKPPPADTTHKGGSDTTQLPTPGATMIYSLTDFGISNWEKSKPNAGALWWVGGGGEQVDFLIYQTDTSNYGVELINVDKGTWTLDYAKYAGDTTQFQFSISNINHYTAVGQAPDTVGKFAIHIYNKAGKNLKPGIKDVYLYFGSTSGTYTGYNGVITFGPYFGDKAKLNASYIANLLKGANFNLTRFVIGNDGD